MRVEKKGYSASPWRLVTDSGAEVYAAVPFDHPKLGRTVINGPVCGKTKTDCIESALRLLSAISSPKPVDKDGFLPCPFCGHPPDTSDLQDVLHPSGTWWRDSMRGGKLMRTYHGRHNHQPGDNRCWTMKCAESHGGCGANVFGHTEQEARDKWNKRA